MTTRDKASMTTRDKASMTTRDRVNVCSDSVAAPSSSRSACKVLWIDTLHGPHISAAIYHELAAHAINKQDLHFICLDILAGQRFDFWYINRAIETLIKQKKPNLVVIDDIDHFMPHCGINIATEVTHVIRDVINHSETAFLFIGYNHLSKKTNTTGNLGKQLFVNASDVFSLSTQREVTTVRHAISYDLSCHPDVSEFNFTIGTDNLPHEAISIKKDKSTPIDDDTLRDIVTDILQPGETITPDEFHHQVFTRYRQLKQQDRTATLLTQAIHLNLITPAPNNNYTLTPIDKPIANSKPNEINNKINVSSDRVDVCSDSVAAPSSRNNNAASDSIAASPALSTINNSLTLPPLPHDHQPSPINGNSTAAPASNETDGSKNRLQRETPCKTLEEGRSLVPAVSSGKCVKDELTPRLA